MMRVILMVLLMAYSSDSLNERVITNMWLHYSSVLSEFLRMVKVTTILDFDWGLTTYF